MLPFFATNTLPLKRAVSTTEFITESMDETRLKGPRGEEQPVNTTAAKRKQNEIFFMRIKIGLERDFQRGHPHSQPSLYKKSWGEVICQTVFTIFSPQYRI